MAKKRVKKNVNDVFTSRAVRDVYDLLTGYQTVGDSLTDALQAVRLEVATMGQRPGLSLVKTLILERIREASWQGIAIGWRFGVQAVRLRVTAVGTTPEGRRLACLSRHAARTGHAIGLRQRAKLHPMHLTRPQEPDEQRTVTLRQP